jgi:hypothetical protein
VIDGVRAADLSVAECAAGEIGKRKACLRTGMGVYHDHSDRLANYNASSPRGNGSMAAHLGIIAKSIAAPGIADAVTKLTAKPTARASSVAGSVFAKCFMPRYAARRSGIRCLQCREAREGAASWRSAAAPPGMMRKCLPWRFVSRERKIMAVAGARARYIRKIISAWAPAISATYRQINNGVSLAKLHVEATQAAKARAETRLRHYAIHSVVAKLWYSRIIASIYIKLK